MNALTSLVGAVTAEAYEVAHERVRLPERIELKAGFDMDYFGCLTLNQSRRFPGLLALCLALVAMLFACTGENDDSTGDERSAELEAKAQALEESLDALGRENSELMSEITSLREQLAERDAQLQELASKVEWDLSDMEDWSKDTNKQSSKPEGTALERTVAFVEDSGGEISYVDHSGRGNRTVLVTPLDFVPGETPLVVSLHGFGGDSAYQAAYVPLHERVNTYGFALMLPNGVADGSGNRFWNPTDQCCQGGKSGEDDVAYLTELVVEARNIKDFGPIYFFGYSNGGFMSHHMACKGLPGLRAVASLAGTSYVEDSSCEGAPPVSVLHVHGIEDSVILFEGDESKSDGKGDGERAFYASAHDMVARWSDRAGCDWPDQDQPHATLDLDRDVPGSETQVFRLESGCGEGINIELWVGEGSSHAPDYGDAFVDALVGWLLSQE